MWVQLPHRKIQFYHLKNLGKKKFSITVINVFGEWDKYIDFLNQLDVDIINLNLKKNLPFLKNKGFFLVGCFILKSFF